MTCLGRRLRTRIDPEHDPDHIASDLDAFDERTNNVALCGPIRRGQAVAHHRGKQVQLADDTLKRADLLFGGLLFAGFGLKSGQAPAQFSKARLKLGLFDQSLRIAVDQAADRTPCFG